MSQSLKGHFLVAGSKLRDPHFFKSVVLIVEHSSEGAMGLVINKPSRATLAETLKGCFEIPENHTPAYLGGPVEPNALFIIHNASHLDPGEAAVIPEVYMGGSAETFEQIILASLSDGSQAGGLRFRIYCGCSGWGPGQLEGELDRGDWLVVPASAAMVFHDDPYIVWEEMMSASRLASRLIDQQCDHPEWN